MMCQDRINCNTCNTLVGNADKHLYACKGQGTLLCIQFCKKPIIALQNSLFRTISNQETKKNTLNTLLIMKSNEGKRKDIRS